MAITHGTENPVTSPASDTGRLVLRAGTALVGAAILCGLALVYAMADQDTIHYA
ncbi:hypothetical protein N857_gp048 [Mycobacterium phage Wanda]|nr:hypothetical protein N857_gp048 [Mycobacterium phage Wanda]AGT11752.1 hypothetical protein PBI_WANDA_48 [Mycobacterium phage Wanda]